MEDSVFTKIIKGELPSHKVYEDDKTIVILSIDPIVDGHCLVIPKEQVERVWQLEDDLYQHTMKVTKEVTKRMIEALSPDRVAMFTDGFGVPHTHVHLIPLPKDKSIEQVMAEWSSSSEPDHDALAVTAKKLFFSS